MGKFFKGGFRRKDIKKIQETKVENLPKRIVTRIITSCPECFLLKSVRLQDNNFLVQCSAMNPNVYLVSSPELLNKMFNDCAVHPLNVDIAPEQPVEPEKPVDGNVQ